jgi:hypothetical protein
LSNIADEVEELLLPATARPTKTSFPILMLEVLTAVHSIPSSDLSEIIDFPLRTSFTQYEEKALPILSFVFESNDGRKRKKTPLDDLIKEDACFEPGSRFSRIITPAKAPVESFRTEITRACISPSFSNF